MKTLRDGIWVAMLTPFDDDNKIDFKAVKALLDFYGSHGVNGVFVNCQSNEVFQMTIKERFDLASFVIDNRTPEMQVVVGVSACENIEAQIEEIHLLSTLHADSYVLITSLLVDKDESDDMFFINLTKIVETFPDLPFGLYECPKPYKRLLSPDVLKRCAYTGRFNFMKETSCDSEKTYEKIKAVAGTKMKIFNANAATLLDTINNGVNGYCGPMANFHPDLYTILWKLAATDKEHAKELHQMLTLFSLIIYQLWPVSAKYYLRLEGVPFSERSRMQDEKLLNFSKRKELQNLYDMTMLLRKKYNMKRG